MVISGDSLFQVTIGTNIPDYILEKIKYGPNTFSVLAGNAIIIKTPLISTLPQPWLHELSINCQGGKMINKPFL